MGAGSEILAHLSERGCGGLFALKGNDFIEEPCDSFCGLTPGLLLFTFDPARRECKCCTAEPIKLIPFAESQDFLLKDGKCLVRNW